MLRLFAVYGFFCGYCDCGCCLFDMLVRLGCVIDLFNSVVTCILM